MKILDMIRWFLFIPAGFIASVVASIFGNFAGSQVSEFIGLVSSGALGAVAFIMAGLLVAPKRSNVVKWMLITISSVLGILSAAGSLFGDDKLKVTTGVCMVVVSLALAKVPPEEIVDLPR